MMCSYNRIYGTWSCENDMTLNQDLKGYMNFSYFVMSDWGGTHSAQLFFFFYSYKFYNYKDITTITSIC